MGDILNPSLYQQLQRVFGEVRICNKGVAFDGYRGRDPLKPSRTALYIKSHGEQYMVCCPDCGDSRFRLYFNHRWGSRLDGEKITHLVQCFNEGCHEKPGFNERMQDLLTAYIARDYGIEILAGTVQDTTPQTVELPGVCYPVKELPDNHMARYYLSTVRRFDVTDLSDTWGVLWCDSSHYANAHERIVFPIYSYREDGVLDLFGYQCRYLNMRTGSDKPPNKMTPKYWTGFGTKKSKLLLNAYRCCYSPVVVLTEGPLDAIRVGPEHGVCAFGKSVSPSQLELLWTLWGQHGSVIVVGLDPDATEEQKDTLIALETAWPAGHVIPLEFPVGTDAGGTDRAVLHRMIIQAGWQAGWDLRAQFTGQ